MNIQEYEEKFRNKTKNQYLFFQILKDQKWHCRGCCAKELNSVQLAGGGGIQGLQRGTKKRPGLVIISKKEFCSKCTKKVEWDRWSGEFANSNSASGIPKKLQKKILELYEYKDVIENRKRPAHELIIDHRFPMERWGETEDANPIDLSDVDIRCKFQLLKKDNSGNHNLLKSRACEKCILTGKRGKPFGIHFYYEGSEKWPEDCPNKGKQAIKGCIGCGWYDFEQWRNTLNHYINKTITSKDK